MDETIVPIGTLSKGDEGTVTDGKFNGRRFRIRSIGSTGRTVMVDWTEYGTKGTIFATTLVLNAFGSESWITDQWTGALADLKDAAHSVGVRTHETDTWAVTHSRERWARTRHAHGAWHVRSRQRVQPGRTAQSAHDVRIRRARQDARCAVGSSEP